MDKQYRTHWKETEARIRDMQESNSAQAQQLAENPRCSQLERQELHVANETRLQLEAPTIRLSQDMEHKTMSDMLQKEQEVQRLRMQTDKQPDRLKERWKKQVSQAATYKAMIHALHTELANHQEKSELKKGHYMNPPRPIVDMEPEIS